MKSIDVNHKDIQALFRGFDKRWPVGRFYYCRYESAETGKDLLQYVGTLTSFYDLDNYPPVAINAALTFRGLRKLRLNPDVLDSFPGDFRQGMRERAGLNRDIDENAPEKWDRVWREKIGVHLWIGVYAKSPAVLSEWDQQFRDWVAARPSNRQFLKRNGSNPDMTVTLLDTQDVKRFWSDNATEMYIDDDTNSPKKPVVLEHFGFRDGVSQPSIQGLDLDARENRAWRRPAAAGRLMVCPAPGRIPVRSCRRHGRDSARSGSARARAQWQLHGAAQTRAGCRRIPCVPQAEGCAGDEIAGRGRQSRLPGRKDGRPSS